MATLPNKIQAGWHIGTMYTLTRIAKDEVMIMPIKVVSHSTSFCPFQCFGHHKHVKTHKLLQTCKQVVTSLFTSS